MRSGHPLEFGRYRANTWLAATGASGDGLYSAVRYVIRLLRLLVLLTIWQSVLGQGSPSELARVLTYTLVAGALANQLDARTDLGEAIWDGRITTWFVAPVRIYGLAVANTFGRWLPSLLGYTLPVMLLAPFLGVDPRPASVTASLTFIPSLALAIAIGFAVDLLLVSLMARTGWSLWDMQRVRFAIGTVLSGAVIPLAYLPWGLADWLPWLPLASMASAPLRIWIGDGDPATLIAMQAAWAAIGWVAALAAWSRQRERLVGYGG
jgi:ABC-2 type transport system permease protein